MMAHACRLSLLATCVLFSLQCLAAGLSKETAAQVKGSYSESCANAKALRVTLSEDKVVVGAGGKTIEGGQVLEAISYLGNSPPEGYVTAILAEARKDATMAVVVYQDGARRMSVMLDLDPPLRKALGVQASDRKLPRC